VKPQPKAAAKAKKPAPKTAVKKPAPKARPAVKKAAPAKKTAVAKKPVKKPVPVKKAAPAKKPAPVKKAAVKPIAKAAKPAAKVTHPVSKKAAPVPKSNTTEAMAPAKAPAKSSTAKLDASEAAAAASARAMPPRPDAATVSASPARATKPSARLAQITVPSMAQSVASTAAKASYIQTMSEPSLLTPPPLVMVKKNTKLANNWKTKSVEELTDEEVLAMPDDEYMNDKQMAFFRRKLSQLKQDILNSAGETTEHLREDTVVVPDPADRATIEEEHALELRTRDRERKLLKKIEQSINSIDAGEYGYCDETGEPIGVGRLLARPTATLSIEAQQRRELKQKMFGD
jgi:DnaK suppressor protein